MKFKTVVLPLLFLLLTGSCISYDTDDFADSTWCASDGATIKLNSDGSCEVTNLNRIGIFPLHWYSDSIGNSLYPSTFTGQWALKTTPIDIQYLKIKIDGVDNFYAFNISHKDIIYMNCGEFKMRYRKHQRYTFTRQKVED